MSTPSIQTLITQAQQVLNLKSSNEIRATLAAILANANVGTPLNPNLTTQQLWDEFYEIVRQPSDDIMSIITDQMMRMVFSPPAPGGAGADKQVIFNDGGVLAGDAGLMYNKATDALTITGALAVDTTTLVVNAAGYTDRVGIGTATPAYLVDVLAAGATTVNDSFNVARFTGASAVANDFSLVGPATSQVRLNFSHPTASGNGEVGYDHATNNLRFVTNGTQKGAFNSTGAFVLAGGDITSNGTGVNFPAVANPSSNAKTLDDYEEGVWSPTVSGQVNLTSTTFVNARYTKIGRVVTVSGSVTTLITLSNTLAYFALQNLPFAAATNVPGPLWNDSRNTSGTTQVAGTILYGFLSAASGTTSGSAMTLTFSNTYTV